MGPFETWVTRLRLAWMGTKAQKIMGGFAAALGDRGLRWMSRAVFEHLPSSASTDSLPLIGSDRLLPQGATESNADYALRLTRAVEQWGYAGTPLGILAALNLAGFSAAEASAIAVTPGRSAMIVVQQNGRAYQLALPLPIDPVDWPSALVKIALTPLEVDLTSSPAGHTIAAGNSWWLIDFRNDLTARFELLWAPDDASGFTADDADLISSIVRLWCPRKARPIQLHVRNSGSFMGWPIRLIGSGTTLGASIDHYDL